LAKNVGIRAKSHYSHTAEKARKMGKNRKSKAGEHGRKIEMILEAPFLARLNWAENRKLALANSGEIGSLYKNHI
jgi:hypothetical protein